MIINDLILISIAGILVYFFIIKSKRRYLLKNGIRAFAKVISVEKTIFNRGSGMSSRPVMEIVLEIENAKVANTQVTIRTTFGFGEIPPKTGDQVNILIDPRNPDNVILSPSEYP